MRPPGAVGRPKTLPAVDSDVPSGSAGDARKQAYPSHLLASVPPGGRGDGRRAECRQARTRTPLDAPPSIGHNLRRAVDEIAAAEGVSNTVTHLVYSHHHADHGAAASLFENVVRIGHEETRRLLLRDNDPAPAFA